MEKMPLYLIERIYLADRTLGSMYSPSGGLICKTLELKWDNNKRSVSCIPEGTYRITKEKPIPKDDPNTEADESGGRIYRPYWHFRIHDVKDRAGILIHIGNDPADSRGCILVGARFGDFNTAFPTLEDSGKKMKWMTDNLPDEFRLLIEEKV